LKIDLTKNYKLRFVKLKTCWFSQRIADENCLSQWVPDRRCSKLESTPGKVCHVLVNGWSSSGMADERKVRLHSPMHVNRSGCDANL